MVGAPGNRATLMQHSGYSHRMEHKVTILAAPVKDHQVQSALSSYRVSGWTLVSVNQSAPNEPMFLFWRKD